MRKPRLVDLFCGAGGATRGYQLAGFHVTGVDIQPQPRYCGDTFIQADAMTFPLDGFDAIHASPPCQRWSIAAKGQYKDYPDLLTPARHRLEAAEVPWVIENVPGAPLRANIKLCGCYFGLKLRRVRWFETSWQSFEWNAPHVHDGPVVSVVGHGTPSRVRQRLGYNPTMTDYRAAMGIYWMNRDELSQAIPPAYTVFVGLQLMAVLESLPSK